MSRECIYFSIIPAWQIAITNRIPLIIYPVQSETMRRRVNKSDKTFVLAVDRSKFLLLIFAHFELFLSVSSSDFRNGVSSLYKSSFFFPPRELEIKDYEEKLIKRHNCAYVEHDIYIYNNLTRYMQYIYMYNKISKLSHLCFSPFYKEIYFHEKSKFYFRVFLFSIAL